MGPLKTITQKQEGEFSSILWFNSDTKLMTFIWGFSFKLCWRCSIQFHMCVWSRHGSIFRASPHFNAPSLPHIYSICWQGASGDCHRAMCQLSLSAATYSILYKFGQTWIETVPWLLCRGDKACGDNSGLFCFVVCLIPGWHFSRFTVWRDLASCEPSWHPYYLALCDPTYFVLLFLCQHAVPPAWLCLLSVSEGWGCFLLWHQDRHKALAHLPK